MRTVSMKFTANEVCAILEGIKTQMRYIINPQPRIVLSCYGDGSIETNQIFRHGDQRLHCKVKPGDKILVREKVDYTKDKNTDLKKSNKGCNSKIQLEVVSVWAERLLDISSHDANCEGCTEVGTHPRADFLAAWEQKHGYSSAASNPWVWVIEFRVS